MTAKASGSNMETEMYNESHFMGFILAQNFERFLVIVKNKSIDIFTMHFIVCLFEGCFFYICVF